MVIDLVRRIGEAFESRTNFSGNAFRFSYEERVALGSTVGIEHVPRYALAGLRVLSVVLPLQWGLMALSWAWGALLSWSSAMVGAAVCFWIARALGPGTDRRRAREDRDPHHRLVRHFQGPDREQDCLRPWGGPCADRRFGHRLRRIRRRALVRLHRLGEGEPYTGLQAATEIDETVEDADKALVTGEVEPLTRLVAERVAAGVRERFARARDLKRHADDSVAAGRRYVAAYVDFIHFVEGLALESAVDPEGRRH